MEKKKLWDRIWKRILKNRWVNENFGPKVDIQMRMCRMIFVIGALGLLLDALYNIFAMRQYSMNAVFPLIGVAFLIAAFWASRKIQDGRTVFFVMLILSNSVLFPGAFLCGGGAESGNPMWMFLGLVLVFLLLDGWRFALVAITSTASILASYVLSEVRPDLLTPLQNRHLVRMDSVFCLLVVAVIVGLLFRFQNALYRRQCELSEQRSQELEDSINSKNLFFANMSHEIRTPINTIIGLNEMILREDVSDEVAENAINIQNASKILLAVINDILDLSKIESGKMDIVPTQYETANMFSDMVNIIWVRAMEKKLEFKIDIDEDIPSMLYGDEVRIKQVLTNILTNAVKYTEKGSVTLSVKGKQMDHNTIRLKISVEDTGIGIRKESLKDLFSVFKRVDQSRTKKIEGTGLGLSIAKQLVEMMGGTITVDSIYQKGSCFTVRLDQKIVDDTPIGSMQRVVRRGAKDRKSYQQKFEAPDARVLVVDDNEMNLMVASKLLRSTKVQVDTAVSGRQCLDMTREKYYHVILMDHMMPDMDGEETLRKLRERSDGYCQRTPVIALTANVMTNANEIYQEKGFEGYLAKPISSSLLEATLQKFLPQELLEFSEQEIEEEGEMEISSMIFHKKKKKIAITADSLCDLPWKWREKYDVKTMHYYVQTDEGRFLDNQELSLEDLLDYIGKGGSAVSSCASAEEYETFFSDRLMEADSVIHIAAASGVGNSFVYAQQAAEGFDNVRVVDSGQLTCGMTFLIRKAVELVQAGHDADEICASLQKYKDKVSTSFLLRTTDSMYRNKRIGKRVNQISHMLKLRPMIVMRRNKITVGGIMTGKRKAEKKYIRHALRRSGSIDGNLLFIVHAGCSVKELEQFKAEVAKIKKFETVRIQKTSSVISSNCGAGCFGLIYQRK